MSRIFYTKPTITELEIQTVTEAVTTGWGDKCYDYIHKFTGAFSQYLGVKHCIATSSCTGALHIALKALGVGPGDEVIVPDTTWIASVAPITYLGAKPVFVDVLEDSWCIDPDKVKNAITPNTKAIIAVHLYGNLCDMNALIAIARSSGIYLIEDAAEAIGSEYHSKRAGSIGDFATFSFHGTKPITTGEGGMLVVNNPDFVDKVMTLENHGRKPGEKRMFWCEEIGFKYRMSNIQAALGFAQMQRIDEIVQKKRQIFGWYYDELHTISGIKLNPEPEGMLNSYWMPTVIFDSSLAVSREKLSADFAAEDIDARVFFYPVSEFPPFITADTPVSHSLYKRAMNLPSYFDITKADVLRVCNVVRKHID